MSNTTTHTEVNAVKVVRTWEERVQELEDLGADRSDAQAIVDALINNPYPKKDPTNMNKKNWSEMNQQERQAELIRVQKADCLFNNQNPTPVYKEDPDAEFFVPATHII
jgi:hypothetical protein